MKLNLDLKNLKPKLQQITALLRNYMVFIFFIAVALIFSFLVFQINSLANHEPTDDQVDEKLQTVQRPKIDQNALNKIQQLQDNSSDVKSLFQHARDNPFQE